MIDLAEGRPLTVVTRNEALQVLTTLLLKDMQIENGTAPYAGHKPIPPEKLKARISNRRRQIAEIEESDSFSICVPIAWIDAAKKHNPAIRIRVSNSDMPMRRMRAAKSHGSSQTT